MIIPKKLIIKDFLSFENQSLEFEAGKTKCIMGRNLTEDNQESNGSGKSAFQSAIELAITGGISRKINKSKMIRWGASESTIHFSLFDNVVNETIAIERVVPVKGSEKLTIKVNDKEVEFATVRDGNDWIEQRIGISRQDISNYFIVNEVNYVSFFNSPDSKKKELISRFSNADIVDGVFENVQKAIDEVTSKIVLQEKEILKCESKIETLRDELNEEINRDFEGEKIEEIKFLNEKIVSFKKNIESYENEISVIKGSISKLMKTIIPEKKNNLNVLKQQIKRFIDDNFDEEFNKYDTELNGIKSKLSKVDEAEKTLISEKREINKDIHSMQYVLDGKLECPNCHHEFNPKSEVTVEEANLKLDEFNKELNELKVDFEKVEALRKNYDDSRNRILKSIEEVESKQNLHKQQKRKLENDIQDAVNAIEKHEKELKSLEREISDNEREIEYERDLIAKYKLKIKEVESSTKSYDRENDLKEKIKTQESLLIELNEILEDLQEKESSTKSWIVNFKLFKSFLANKKLKIIQDMINHYLEEMGCDYKLKLEGYKQLSSGDLREKITPYIYKNGDICDYGEFSKGERARIDFATLLTLQTLVNESCEKGGLDLLMCDEIMEGLDSKGLNSILKSFSNTGKTSFITTHVVNDQLYDDVLIVEKINGISKIK